MADEKSVSPERRLDLLGVVLLLVLVATVAITAYGAIALGWFSSWWELGGVVAALVAFIAVGLGVQGHRQPKNANVYGSAKTVTETEARSAARGETKVAALHDRTFPD